MRALNKMLETAARFRVENNGNVTMIFGLALLPALLFIGAAIDYTRASDLRARLQHATDSAVLAAAEEPTGVLTKAQAAATTAFNANFPNGGTINVSSPASHTWSGVSTGSINTSFMRLAGINSISVGANSTAVSAQKNIEIALVLDNTGSMADNGKIQALRASVTNLLTNLQSNSLTQGDTKVSLVPFTTSVKVDPATYKTASWLRWDVVKENTGIGSYCWNYVISGRTYQACGTAYYRNPPVATATPATSSSPNFTWNGCITDRDQSFDTQSVPVQSGVNNLASKYPVAKCLDDGLLPMTFLTTDLNSVKSQVSLMQPRDATNVTIGFVNGLSTLRSDHPFGANASSDSKTLKFLVLLTDGNNTMNRFGGNGYDGNFYASTIDQRLQTACQQAQSDGTVRIFTVRVMDGNAGLLQSCAVNGGKYYDVQNASQMQGVFDDILRAITNARLVS
jgi:Flp pilus assembly protein TadG